MSDEKQYEIVYFKPSGKYYTSEKVTWPKDAPDHSGWNPISTFHRIGEMYAVCMNAPHGFPQFSPPKTVYDLQQTIYELNCRVAELKRQLAEKVVDEDIAEIVGFAEGFEEATEKGEKAMSQALSAMTVADAAVLRGVQTSGQNATPDSEHHTIPSVRPEPSILEFLGEAKTAFAPSDVARLQEQLAMAKREINSLGEVLEDIRVALGQNGTHYLVMADDVKALVHAVSQCEGGDGKCPAQTVLALLQQDPGCGGSKEAPTDIGCAGTPGAASWGRCEKSKDHPPPCTHDPAPRVAPGENLRTSDPRFGTPEHMRARWKNARIRGPFFIESVPYAFGEGPEPAQRYYIRECYDRKCIAECNGRPIADAVLDALDAYKEGK